MKAVLAALVLALLSACSSPTDSPADSGPGATQYPKNVVVFVVDDLGWRDLGSYGSSFYETPNIDALAAQGARFTDAYAASPVCSPTRAALLTGRHPSRVSITDWIPGRVPENARLVTPEDRSSLALDEVTLAEVLKEHGYQTFFAGKWHLGDEGHLPQDQGFEINKGGDHRGSPPSYYAPFGLPLLEDKRGDHHLTERLTDECLEFLDSRDHEKPFLMYMSYYTVHTPIQGWDVYDDYFEDKQRSLPNGGEVETRREHSGTSRINQSHPQYAAMVKGLDVSVGRILDALEEQGLRDDTIVIFTSDNGGLSTLSSPGPTAQLPLRSGKGWCYEGGIRVPLIISGPGIGTKGETIDTPSVSMDIFPTILELVGLPAREDLHMDGISLQPLLEGESIGGRALFWHFPHYHSSTWTPGAAIRDGDWKLIQFYESEETELYNLRDDIGEMDDLSTSHPEKTAELLEKLKAMQADTGSELPYPRADAATAE